VERAGFTLSRSEKHAYMLGPGVVKYSAGLHFADSSRPVADLSVRKQPVAVRHFHATGTHRVIRVGFLRDVRQKACPRVPHELC
jgi:hypothetical protein